MYMPDDTGVYTDTAEFVDLVAECTNISIGYEREHSDEEAQDILHLQALAQQVVRMDWDALPVVRDPLAEPEDLYGGRWGTPAPYKRRDYDFKLFLSAEELDAYNTILDAADGRRVQPLAVHVAAAIASWYPECTPEMLFNRALTACDGAGINALRDYAAEIEEGAEVQDILQAIYEDGQPI